MKPAGTTAKPSRSLTISSYLQNVPTTMKLFRRNALVFYLTVFVLSCISGCVHAPVTVDGGGLKKNQGLLVLKIQSNVKIRLTFVDFVDQLAFGNPLAELVGPVGYVHGTIDEKYAVIPLDAGDYMWSKIEVYPLFSRFYGSTKFKVVPNSLTYIGDISVNVTDKRFSIVVTDGDYQMREYVASNYPEYVKSFPIVKMLAEFRL